VKTVEMSLVGRLLSSRRTLTESESREAERRALINDLTVQNARYQATIWFVSSVAFALLIPGINVVISFLGALAAAFIVVFPGLCLIKLSLDRKDAADGKLLLSQTSQMPPSPRKNEGEFSFAKFCLFFGYGVLLVVLGMFIFGIIVTNSCTTKTTKLPLCV